MNPILFAFAFGVGPVSVQPVPDAAAAARMGCEIALRGFSGKAERELSTEFERRYDVKLVKATGIDAAIRWRRLGWQDEHGDIPVDAFQRALAQRRAVVAASQTAGRKTAAVDWVERGPNNVAGRSRTILIDPRNSNNLFMGSVSGGIWHSTNAGASWQPVDDRMAPLAIGCLAYDTSNPDILYAGTGEGYFNGDAIGGRGLFKSVDGGATWNVLPNTIGWGNVCSMSVSPTNSQVILCGIRYGGIQRSTDGGATWSNPYWAQGGFFVSFHPTDGSKAVATVIDYDWDAGNWFHRALYSTDGGVTWQPATGDVGKVFNFDNRITLAYAKSDPNIVYASCAVNGGKVYRSTDGGKSYSLMTGGATTGVSWYANPLWVDPTNPNRLITGGYHLYKSEDGGTTFTQMSDGYMMGDQPHVDMHLVASGPGFDGVTDKRIYVCNDGGTWTAPDVYAAGTTSGWTRIDLHQRTTQFYGAAGHGGANLIIGGTQDNGTQQLTTGTDQSNLMFGGDGGWCAIDPTNYNYCYGEYVNLQIHRSTNGGLWSSYIYTGIGDAGSNANFIAPFILDPNNAARMLAGGRRLWRTNNVRATTPSWTSIRASGTDNISAIAVAPGNSNVVWVGQNDGVVSKTVNGTATTPTWTAIDDNSGADPFPNRYVHRILIDPSDSNTVYVSLGGFSANNLWKTTNGGTTWTAITGTGSTGLPDVPIRGIARHPLDPYRLYLGTEVGVFMTANGGSTWTTSDFGPATVSTDEVNFMSGSQTLLAATHGRGLWTLDQQLHGASNLSSSPSSPVGGSTATGTVTLSGPALTGGAVVVLNSANPALASVPATVTVPEGEASASFPIVTASVSTTTAVALSATYAGATANLSLQVRPIPVSGSVTLQDFLGDKTTVPITVVIRNPGSTAAVETHVVNLAADGSFSFETGLNGTYDVAVRGPHWLRKAVKNVSFGPAGVSGLGFSLVNGDTTGDNAINLPDLTAISAAWRSTPGSPTWNPAADLNGDGSVNLADFTIVSRNWRKAGDP